MSTTTKTIESTCLVCDGGFKEAVLASGWRNKHEIPEGLSVCPWCANRGWPKFKVMFETLTAIASGASEGDPAAVAAEEALWFVVGVPPEVSSPTDQEREEAAQAALQGPRRVVRKVKRRH